MKSLLCLFILHDWKYYSTGIRRCLKCGKLQYMGRPDPDYDVAWQWGIIIAGAGLLFYHWFTGGVVP
jgi:hypothetical protein